MLKCGPAKESLCSRPRTTGRRARTRVVKLLNERLADAIDRGTQSQHAHWNVKGPNADTADLFTGISRDLDRQPWFLEAHLHAKR
jgi:DNA-binding ferritin-like protein